MRPCVLLAVAVLLPVSATHAQSTPPPTQTTPLVVTTNDQEQPAISAINIATGPFVRQQSRPAAIYAQADNGVGVAAEGGYLGASILGVGPFSTGLMAVGGLEGVVGSCWKSGCHGVWGRADYAAGTGVVGEGPTGIVGIASAPSLNFNQPVYAGRFQGDVTISEDLAVAGTLSSPTISQLQAEIASLTARLLILESRAESPISGLPVPGRIMAESYNSGGQGVGYFDTTPGNEQGVAGLRNDDVDLKAIGEGEYAVGWFAAGEWLAYTVAVAETATYSLRASVSTPLAGRTFHVEVDGRNVTGSVAAPQLAGWGQFVTVELPRVALTAGTHLVRVVMGPQDFMDFRWLEFTR